MRHAQMRTPMRSTAHCGLFGEIIAAGVGVTGATVATGATVGAAPNMSSKISPWHVDKDKWRSKNSIALWKQRLRTRRAIHTIKGQMVAATSTKKMDAPIPTNFWGIWCDMMYIEMPSQNCGPQSHFSGEGVQLVELTWFQLTTKSSSNKWNAKQSSSHGNLLDQSLLRWLCVWLLVVACIYRHTWAGGCPNHRLQIQFLLASCWLGTEALAH